MSRLLYVLVYAIAIILLQSTAFRIPFGVIHRKAGCQSTIIYSQVNYQEDNAESTTDNHIFLRFSPLIGGPTFLPLHVEVIIIVDEDVNNSEEMIMDTVYISRNNNLSSTFLNKQQKLQFHRFDFLPERPTDPSTISRLSTLQAVPGNVRYRTSSYNTSSSNIPNNKSDNEKSTTNQMDGKGITILLPIGSLSCNVDYGISKAIQFKEKYSDTIFKELRIIGGKNCLQFALDLLSHIDTSTTGIQRVTKLNSLDIK